jgi:hypothetical protein
MTKNWKKFPVEKKLYIFLIKNCDYLYLGLRKGRSSCRRSLQPSKDNIQFRIRIPDPDPKHCTLALLLPPVTTCMKQEGGRPLGPALPGSQSLPGTRPPTCPPSQARDPALNLHLEQMTILLNVSESVNFYFIM